MSAGWSTEKEISVAATDAQARRVMEELSKHGSVSIAAAPAGVDRKTAAKYRDAGRPPSELKEPRSWRARAWARIASVTP